MSKTFKSLLGAFIVVLLTVCLALPVQALSNYQRKMYGQNNIIFYKPCGTEETVSAAETAASTQVTAYGQTVEDKFYYAFSSLFKDQTKTQKFFAYFLYISRFYNNQKISNWVTLFNINANPSDIDLENFLNYAVYSDDSVTNNLSNEKVNLLVAYLVYSAKSQLEELTLPEGDSDYDTYLEQAKAYTPQGSSSNAKSYPTNVTVPEDTDSSTAECANTILSTSVDPGTPSGEGVDYIVDIAIKASWPTNGQCKNAYGAMIPWTGPRKESECSNTLNDFGETIRKNSGTNTLQDCGKFVGAVIRYSKLDSSFPSGGVYRQMQHMESSSKWTKVSTDGQEFPITSLKPGDVLAYSEGQNAGATKGHIMIYIGSRTATTGSGSTVSVNVASASYNNWTPQVNKLRYMSSNSGKGIPYSVYRYTGN